MAKKVEKIKEPEKKSQDDSSLNHSERRLYAKKNSNRGAKSKFDLWNEEIIIRTLNGCSLKDRLGGLIVESTYWEWFKAGESDLVNGIESKYSVFSSRVKESEKIFRDSLRNSIKRHSENDWKAASWLLERSDPESYKLKDKVDVTSNGETLGVPLFLPLKTDE